LQNTKINAANMLVITDDISLPFGVLRMRKKGSDGGHNGLKNIQAVLGNSNFPRLRFGVGDDFSRGKQVEYVLDDFLDEDYTTMNNRMEMAVKMIQAFATIGIEYAMSDFNGK
jgi:PTH1 family peptidyl-tRNA hydrolase